MPLALRKLQRSSAIISLEVDVTVRSKGLLRDGRMALCGRDVERRGPMRVLVVDEGLRALCRQQRANLCYVTNKRGLAKLLPVIAFALPPFASSVYLLAPCMY